MSSAVTWIIDNKDWLFSGFGIVIAGWILKHISKVYGDKAPEDKATSGASASGQIAVSGQIHTQGGDVHIHNTTTTNQSMSTEPSPPSQRRFSTVTPEEIQKKLSAASPFQKVSISDHYKGLRVRWDVKFYSISHLSSSSTRKKYQLHLDPEVSLIFFVKGRVDIDDYPELKIAEKDAVLTVEGLIESVDELGVYLDIEDVVVKKNN